MNIGIFLHIHHQHVGVDILDDLRRVKGDYRLFVTHSKPLSGQIISKIAQIKAPTVVKYVENRGRDILPFLTLLNSPETDEVDLVVKIHTKRTSIPHFDTWSKISYQPLIERNNFHRIRDEFNKNKKLIILGTKENYKHGPTFWFGNEYRTELIYRKLFQKNMPLHWGFFAGTMFWARKDAFVNFLNLDDQIYPFEHEPIGDNKSVSHAAERLFGMLPVLFQGHVGTIDALSSEIETFGEAGFPSTHPMSQDWKRIEAAWAGRIPTSKSLLSKIIRKIKPILARIRRKLSG